MAFHQPLPTLGNQYDDDRVLQSYLKRVLPEAVWDDVQEPLHTMGELAGGSLYALQQADRRNEPVLTQWDAWGERIDRVEVTKLWQEAERLAAQHGLIATAYEQKHGVHARLHQFALVYLFTPSTDLYSCPLAMTDGAARALLAAGNNALILEALPHLTSRNPAHFWTSGQWMTELPGGSDLSRTETVARKHEDGSWRLYGRKWFTSAIQGQMALTLARPEGGPDGTKGLALFYVELRDEEGRLQRIHINRLKNKLGTRKVPTAELILHGTPALPVKGLTDGIRHIAPMLNITRTWNAVTAVSLMRRGLALARDYARKREAFDTPLAAKPLHADTLATLQATFEGAFHLAFRVAELLGQAEVEDFENGTEAPVHPLLRVLTPLAKLTTARQAVPVLSEVIEAFGGAGYVEDTGLPVLLRDAQVLPIWEGTTNVLALDVLRALKEVGGLELLRAEVKRCAVDIHEPGLIEVIKRASKALDDASTWLTGTVLTGQHMVEAGARRFALTLGLALELALLARHAQWALDHEHDARSAAAARRLAAAGFPSLATPSLDATFALANDTALPTSDSTETSVSNDFPIAEITPHSDWGDGFPDV